MLEALSELDTRADPDVTARPEGGEGAPSTTHVKVQDSLKPLVLTKEHSPLEFNQWASMFRAFYHSSHLERLEDIGQITFLIDGQHLKSNSILSSRLWHLKIFNFFQFDNIALNSS